jgi:transketolase
MEELDRTLAGFDERSVPRAIVADTIKGRGISFMEHPAALKAAGGLYPWHAGAPDDEAFRAGWTELEARVQEAFASFGLGSCALDLLSPETLGAGPSQSLGGEPLSEAAQSRITARVSDEYVAKAFGQALVDLAPAHPELVVLDADLAADCRIRAFENTFPDRFIENGIAEQDMVSMAGGLARQGLLPVVNSFASFLAARANEQIYNNNGERSKVIYVCHYAGLIPAGPGKSHQSVRDISLLASLPDFTILQPANAEEARAILEWCVREATGSCAIRLAIGPSPRRVTLPPDYTLAPGTGVALTPGSDAVLFAYGPVMLHEALLTSELLAERGVGLRVVNMPWLNRVEDAWLVQIIDGARAVCVLEDHAPVGALGDMLVRRLWTTTRRMEVNVRVFGVEGHPACGTPSEALRFHRLDALSLCERILELLNPR